MKSCYAVLHVHIGFSFCLYNEYLLERKDEAE